VVLLFWCKIGVAGNYWCDRVREIRLVKIRVEDLGVDRDEQCGSMMFALPIQYISSFAFEKIRVMCILSTYLIPLEFNIFERRGAHDRETDQKHISLRVGEWPQSVVVLLKTDY
jgi:hypothetical protein